MFQLVQTLAALTVAQWRAASKRDAGATAIEWAIFAILALAIAGAVAGVITAAVNNRTPQIK